MGISKSWTPGFYSEISFPGILSERKKNKIYPEFSVPNTRDPLASNFVQCQFIILLFNRSKKFPDFERHFLATENFSFVPRYARIHSDLDMGQNLGQVGTPHNEITCPKLTSNIFLLNDI